VTKGATRNDETVVSEQGHAVAALEGRKACLLANHGMLAPGKELAGQV
jgi:ribulose-5-phosphate 4-epimerase/fuculose-1-phosphate aldolase